MSTLDERARDEYEKNPVPHPSWDQLGEATKNAWREMVNPPTLRSELALGLVKPVPCTAGRGSVVTMFNNVCVVIVAPNDDKLTEAISRINPKFSSERLDVVLFNQHQVALDDEI